MTTNVCWATQPNSRNCAYRAAKMVSASPRQLTRKRRTTEWRPGEVSTRSLGKITTPVLTSWIGPPPPGARVEASPDPGAADGADAPACPTWRHLHPAPPPLVRPGWRRLHCDCRHGSGSTLYYSDRPTRLIAGLLSKCPWG